MAKQEKRRGRLTNQERDRIKLDALNLFVQGYTLQTIATMPNISVSVDSLRRWSKKHDWEEEKRLNNISPREIKQMITKNVAAIKQGKKMPYSPDSVTKLVAAWDKIDDHRKSAVYAMESFNDFADWMVVKASKQQGKKRDKTIEDLQVFRTYQDEYLQSLLDD